MKYIRLMLSCGQIEEGILENWCEQDTSDQSRWVVISIKDNPNKKLRINKKYIAAHQMEDVADEDINSPYVLDENRKVITVDEFSKKEIRTNNKFNTNPITRAKVIAEQRLAEESLRKQKVSQEYAENVYASPNSMLRKL